MANPTILDEKLHGPMRHVDNLMGISRMSLAQKAKLAEDKQARTRALDEMVLEANSLTTFVRSDGWEFMRRALANEAAVVKGALATCTEPTTLAKGVGALLLLDGYQSWPADRIRDLTAAIEELKAEK